MLRENGMLGDDRTVNTLNTAKKSAEGAARAIQEKSAALWREELEREKRDVATGLMRRFRRQSTAPQAPRTHDHRKRTLRSAIVALGGDLPTSSCSSDAGHREDVPQSKILVAGGDDAEADDKHGNKIAVQDAAEDKRVRSHRRDPILKRLVHHTKLVPGVHPRQQPLLRGRRLLGGSWGQMVWSR